MPQLYYNYRQNQAQSLEKYVFFADYHQWPQSKRNGKDIMGPISLTITNDHSREQLGKTVR